MDRHTLADLFTTAHGNILPIVEEIVNEYAPYHEFNISFKYNKAGVTQGEESVYIRFLIPPKDEWTDGEFEGTKVRVDKRNKCFKFVKLQGNYQVSLDIPFEDYGLDPLTPCWTFMIERCTCISIHGMYCYKILIETKLKLSTPSIYDAMKYKLSGDKYIKVEIDPRLEIYSTDTSNVEEYLWNTHLNKFMQVFG